MVRATRPRPQSDPLPTIAQRFAAAVYEDPEKPFVHDGERVFSRAEIATMAERISVRLLDAGVVADSVVAVQLPNRAWTIAALHAVWALGAVPCAITPIYRGAELRPLFASARPVAVLVPSGSAPVDFVAMATDALSGAGIDAPVLALDVDDEPGEPIALAPAPPASADDVALLMFTSGTTGHAKGVLHTHRTLTVEAQSFVDVFALDDAPVFMPSPLGHVTGLCYGIVMPLLTGSSVVLMDRWDADAAVDRIERAACRFTVSATPFLKGLTDAYRARDLRSSLRVFVCGGADIPTVLVEDARAVMGTTVCRTYGSTEMPTLCIVRPDDPAEIALSTEGRLLGGAARLVDVDGDLGDLEVQGPELFVGYLEPGDNEAAFTPDGWFRTGDLARIRPTGEIAIAGRRKDLIVRGGENISAKEIEDLLLTHPAIADVAVVGMPDGTMGERACAVVIAAGASLRLTDLSAHLATTGIARQKFPEALWTTTTFPRTPSGKVQKFQLRALVLAAAERGEVELRER